MQKSKIGFSPTELKLVNDRELILTKTRAIETVYTLFGEIGTSLFENFKTMQTIYPEVFAILPKISKGENYLGFPWVMLDYPRYFHQKHGHFAFRVFFWWGHYFMVQVHVSDRFANFIDKFILHESFKDFAQFNETYLGHPTDPWDNTLPQPAMYRSFDYDPNNKAFANSYGKIMVPVRFDNCNELPEIVLKLGSIARDIMEH
jgi:hypothetical protein